MQNYESGCAMCENYGQCDRAFHNQPGKFCGHWINDHGTQLPCCCPKHSMCQLSTYKCMCRRLSSSTSPPTNIIHHRRNGIPFLVLLLFFITFLILGAWCYLAFKKSNNSEYNEIPHAIPVKSPIYGSYPGYNQNQNPVYQGYIVQQPNAPPPPYYPENYNGRSSNNMMGMAATGIAGLATGAMLGSMLSRPSQHYNNDIMTSTTFEGDSGDAEDTGDGGDFEGDF